MANEIIFDARHIIHGYSGLARYTFCLLKALLEISDSDRIKILVEPQNRYLGNPLYTSLLELGERFESAKFVQTIDLWGRSHHFKMQNVLLNNFPEYQVYFYPHFDLPFSLREKESLFVVHDLLPLVIDGYVRKWVFLKKFYMTSLLKWHFSKKHTRCIAVSESTRDDLTNFVGTPNYNPIQVVLEDSVLWGQALDSDDSLYPSPKEEITLFYIGDRRPHKNIKLMVDLVRGLNEASCPVRLLLAGSQQNFGFNLKVYLTTQDKVEELGVVSDEQLLTLYKQADGLLFLSKYEGFGLPVVEAGKLGKKIICHDCSSLREVAPDWALLLNPDDSFEQKVLKSKSYLQAAFQPDLESYRNKFSWEKAAIEIFGKYL